MPFDELIKYLTHPAITAIVAIVFVAALVLLAWMRRERPPRYAACASLLTDSELVFHGALEEAVSERYRIVCKVRMADIVQPAGGLETGERQSALNRISSKHLDFVLCEPDNFVVAAAIELDDRSHRRRDRQERDAFVEEVFAETGVPLVRFPVCREYSPEEIALSIEETIANSRSDS